MPQTETPKPERGKRGVRSAQGAMAVVEVALTPGVTTVKNWIRGDRRFVLLETAFE